MPGHQLPSSPSSKSLLEDPARLQAAFASFRSPSTIHEDGEGDADEARNGRESVEEIERQLQVSAQLGLALLERQEQLTADKKALQGKQRELEASISQLLDRLASSYKENAQVIKVGSSFPWFLPLRFRVLIHRSQSAPNALKPTSMPQKPQTGSFSLHWRMIARR
jgi:hypothetical protein